MQGKKRFAFVPVKAATPPVGMREKAAHFSAHSEYNTLCSQARWYSGLHKSVLVCTPWHSAGLVTIQCFTKKLTFFSSIGKIDTWLIYRYHIVLSSSQQLLQKQNLTCRSSWLLLLLLLWLLKVTCVQVGHLPPLFPVCPNPPLPGFPSSYPIPDHSIIAFVLWIVPYSVFWNEAGNLLLLSCEE